MKDLPRFRHRGLTEVEMFASQMLTNKEDTHTTLRRLIEHDDHSFRAVFEPRYFVLPEGSTEPTKSQWNSLKKKFKRSDPTIFIFKEHGKQRCEDRAQAECFYVDFGFFPTGDLPVSPAGASSLRNKPSPRKSKSFLALSATGGLRAAYKHYQEA